MRQITEDKRLPADVEAEAAVQAAAALRSVIRGYHDELEREQRLPKALVEQFHAAGFYRLVRPRELGGLQADPLTYLRVVELLAEGSGSVGWNLCNNNIAQLVTLGLPDEGIREIYGPGGDVAVAGTAVQGGGRAVPVDGGYRVTGRWPFGTGCQESPWMLGSFQILDGDQPRRSPDGASVYWRGVFHRSEAQIVAGSWDVAGLRPPAASTGRSTTSFCRSGERWSTPASRSTTSGATGRGSRTRCRPRPGSGPITAP